METMKKVGDTIVSGIFGGVAIAIGLAIQVVGYGFLTGSDIEIKKK